MQTATAQHASPWREGLRATPLAELDADVHVDVCIIGAGITGLTTAERLLREGRSVLLLDTDEVGGRESIRTTAHLTHALDHRYSHLEHLHGERAIQLAAESHSAAIDAVETFVRGEGIDCDFERVDGYLVLAANESNGLLHEELEAAHRAGLSAVRYVGRVPCETAELGPALKFPRQAQLHAGRYLSGLATAVRQAGARFAGARVTAVEEGRPAHLKTANGHTVTAEAFVVATHTPINNVVTLHTKQAAYRTYAIGARVPARSVSRCLLWDTGDPYHYARLATSTPTHDLLIVGGEDHKTGQADDAVERYARLMDWSRARFPIESIDWRWSGQILEPNDGLAFIGRNPHDERIFVATGYSGNGLTYGTIAGRLLADLIIGRENPWAELYEPSRVTLRATPEFARETVNFVAQYADLARGGDLDNASEIAPGCGAVLRRGLKKVAVFKDERGSLHVRSAVCPHLGCIVHWNDSEKTWDCPCHGSRFATDGQVLNGPAVRALEAEELD